MDLSDLQTVWNEEAFNMRTELAEVKQVNDKWNVSFNTFMGKPGSERLLGVLTTPAVFADEDAAYAAGRRALDILEKTGMFPNFSEPF